MALAIGGCGGGGGDGTPEGPGLNPGAQPPGTVGELSLVVGGVGGAGNADGQGGQARFSGPSGLAFDADGNLYVSDQRNAAIRKITPQAQVSTFATAGLASPGAMARDAAGSLFVLDGASIRRVTPAGVVSTVARHANFSSWTSLAVDASGRLYGVHRIEACLSPTPLSCGVKEQVQVATLAADPEGVAVDTSSFAQETSVVFAVANDAQGRVVVASLGSTAGGVLDFLLAGAGGAFARLDLPESARRLTGDCSGCHPARGLRMSVAWEGDEGFRVALSQPLSGTTMARVSRNGAALVQSTSSRLSSVDGPFAQAGVREVAAIALDAQRRLFFADTQNEAIRVVSAQGDVSTWAGMAPDTGLQDKVQASLPSADPKVKSFCNVAVGGNGADLYMSFCEPLMQQVPIASVARTQIFRIAGGTSAEEFTLGQGLYFFRRNPFAVDAAGDIYVDGRRYGKGAELKADFNADDFPVVSVVVGPQGRVFMASATQVRTLAPGAAAPVVLAGGRPQDADAFTRIRELAVDADGNVYALDGSASSTQVKKVSADGTVRALAGRPGAQGAADGPGSSATFRDAQGLAVDRHGNVFVADTGNHTVRKVTPAGVVSTLVGVPGQSGTGLGALPGRLTTPRSVAVDADDVLYIATPGAILKVKLPQ